MADGKVVIETDLDSSGIKKGLSKLGNLTTTGLFFIHKIEKGERRCRRQL